MQMVCGVFSFIMLGLLGASSLLNTQNPALDAMPWAGNPGADSGNLGPLSQLV